MAISLHLRKDDDGFHVVDGHRRLTAALSMQDEILVESPGIGEVLIVKLPDGRMVATQDKQTMALLGLCRERASVAHHHFRRRVPAPRCQGASGVCAGEQGTLWGCHGPQ